MLCYYWHIWLVVSYILEHILGLYIALAYFAYTSLQYNSTSRNLYCCLGVFHDCTAFLTFSIQVAAIVVLVEVDFSLDANNMGDATVRITEAVSLLTLLPLAYTTILLHNPGGVGRFYQEPTVTTCNKDSKEAARYFSLFMLYWILLLYPFYSKMNSDFRPSKISAPSSQRPNPVISNEQFSLIEEVCFQDVEVITSTQDSLMTVIAIVSFIPLSLIVLGRIIFLAIRKHHIEPENHTTSLAASYRNTSRTFRRVLTGLLSMVPFLAYGLLWTVFCVQRLQKEIALANSNDYLDSQWTFGQIVAVTVFTLVLFEIYRMVRKA